MYVRQTGFMDARQTQCPLGDTHSRLRDKISKHSKAESSIEGVSCSADSSINNFLPLLYHAPTHPSMLY